MISRITDSIRNDVDPLFSNTLTSLNDQVSSIIDEDYGIIAGINCRPLFLFVPSENNRAALAPPAPLVPTTLQIQHK